ncbi:alpha-amylase family glycosyl hydrolase, partial [Clostridium perfringens]
VIEKLDYLKNLRVDYIWMTPFYVYPQKHNGSDIADYYKIDPRYGTLEDFEEVVKEAKGRNIDIMLEMVFIHTSPEHDW